jgi:hypothetical protein
MTMTTDLLRRKDLSRVQFMEPEAGGGVARPAAGLHP